MSASWTEMADAFQWNQTELESDSSGKKDDSMRASARGSATHARALTTR